MTAGAERRWMMAIPAEDILKTLPPEERAAIEKRSAELLAECQNPPA